jgi:hypothetical protein
MVRPYWQVITFSSIIYLSCLSKWILQHLYRITDTIVFSHLNFRMIAHNLLNLGDNGFFLRQKITIMTYKETIKYIVFVYW